MFTGIIETVGTVSERRPGLLTIEPRRPLKGLEIGESISVDGVCLTLDRVKGFKITFRLLPETMRVTTLGGLRVGDGVNLEQSLRLGDRLGGHLLLGHVDGCGRISARHKSAQTFTLEIEIPKQIGAVLVPKGPIAVDGVSLTIGALVPGARKVTGTNKVQVHLIAHTLSATALGQKPIGGLVNLELDLVAKYLRGML